MLADADGRGWTRSEAKRGDRRDATAAIVANVPIARRLVTAIAVIAAGVVPLWLWAEDFDRRASLRWLGSTPRAPDPSGSPAQPRVHAVVVLGYGNRGERANFINRFRVRAGIRSLDPHAENLLVLCGGPVHSATSEAVIMQRYARDRLAYAGRIALDTTSRSTRKNIAHAIPMIEHADTIAIVSNAPHAEKGREILWRERPDLAVRLVRGAEHQLGHAPVLKILGSLRAVYAKRTGLWARSSQNRHADPAPGEPDTTGPTGPTGPTSASSMTSRPADR